ncbi:MAG: hypothetical protein WC699_02655 [Bacteroidales bacterium]
MKTRLFLILLLLITASTEVRSQLVEREAILQTAVQGINVFIKDLPDGSLNDFGFLNKTEMRQFTFAAPIPVYTLKDTAMVFTGTWRVPIVIDKEYRSLLTVIREAGSFKAVDFGAVELAKAYQLNKTRETVGMLRVYQLRKDFLIERNATGKVLFLPVEYNR